jgi:TolB-like protein
VPSDVAHGAESAGPDAASIAVLPFADLSQAGDQGYFSDGMSEEILNVLAKSVWMPACATATRRSSPSMRACWRRSA